MKQLTAWHQTRLGFAVFGAIELLLTYGFASLAIDRGSWWWYVLALVFLAGACRNAARLAARIAHGKH